MDDNLFVDARVMWMWGIKWWDGLGLRIVSPAGSVWRTTACLIRRTTRSNDSLVGDSTSATNIGRRAQVSKSSWCTSARKSASIVVGKAWREARIRPRRRQIQTPVEHCTGTPRALRTVTITVAAASAPYHGGNTIGAVALPSKSFISAATGAENFPRPLAVRLRLPLGLLMSFARAFFSCSGSLVILSASSGLSAKNRYPSRICWK